MKRVHRTITPCSLLFHEPISYQEATDACAALIGDVLTHVEEKSGVKQTAMSVGATTIQVKEGQCVVLFVASVDQEPREETP